MTVQSATSAGRTALDETVVDAFIASLRGRVIRPGDEEYDAARSVQNGLIDRKPAIIVRCRGVADVIDCVNLARDYNLTLCVRGGGHNVTGNAVCDDGLVVDLSEMRGVRVDAVARRVHVQGGATWADVDRETQVFGLATPGGAVSTTGVAGLTLHGGMGHLRRKYGLSLDNLVSVDIVTADGQFRHASETENADLFWAVRGAGSNFGVVTSFEFSVHPVGPELALCAVLYEASSAPVVFARWRDFMDTASEEISSLALLWTVPPGFPEDVVGKDVVAIAAVYSGPPAEGERAMQPLRELTTPLLDISHTGTYGEIQSAFDPFFPKGLLYYWKSIYLDELSDEAVSEMCRFAAERPSPLSDITIWHHGGAMHRVDPAATAFSNRNASYMASIESTWTDPATREANLAWARNAWDAMRRYSGGQVYLNFAGFGEERDALVRPAYGQNYERLAALKHCYDPQNLFHMNLNITPSTS